MTRQETWLDAEAPGRITWTKIEGPIDNYGEDWGGILVPLIQNFTVGPEDSSSGTDLLSGLSSNSSSGDLSEVARPTETESSDDMGENNKVILP